MTDWSNSSVIIHIGYQRTLTTWLQKHVFSNADAGFELIFPDNKGRTFPVFIKPYAFDFSSEKVRETLMELVQPILDRGRTPVLSNERFVGSPVSGCYDVKLIADRLHSVFPEGRVIIGIREQRSMILSHYLRYVSAGGSEKLETYTAGNPRERHFPTFQWAVFEYHFIIEYYQSLFGRENVLICPLELFKADTDLYLDRLIRFTGTVPLSNPPVGQFEKSNYPVTTIGVKRLVNSVIVRSGGFTYRRGLWRLKTPRDWPDRIVPQALETRALRAFKQRVSNLVGDRYRDSNAKLRQLCDLDLEEFGYLV